MARGRMFRPEHRAHRKVGPLTHLEYRLWAGMILEADDFGRLVCDPAQLAASIFPYHKRITHRIMEAAILKLAALGLIVIYEISGIRYSFFPSWSDWQRPKYPTPSKLPAPGFLQSSAKVSPALGKRSPEVEVEGEEQEEVEGEVEVPSADLFRALDRLKNKFGKETTT